MTTAEFDPNLLLESTVVGVDNENIGKVGQVYLDNDTGRPNWVTVRTGWFGINESFVPLDAATFDGDTLRVPFDKATIKDAPNYETDAPLGEYDEQQLYSYYRVGGPAYGDGDAATSRVDTYGDAAVGTARTDGGEYLTRSEEQLHVGTETVEAGRARLRKYVVTENQTVTVPVSHEEVRMVREPVAPGDDVDATIGEADSDVVLTEERVVVEKETVPVEKVRLDTETVTEQQQVSESVRKEEIELDDESGTDYSGQVSDAGYARQRSDADRPVR